MNVEDRTQAATARKLLSYDPVTGDLWWKFMPFRRTREGTIAGCVRSDKYRIIGIHGTNFLAHRLAWLITYGDWPKGQIDHVNMNRDDNRLSNLRDVSVSSNQANCRARRDSPFGMKGVGRHKDGKRFRARIHVEGKEIYLGVYSTPEQAHAAYCAASVKYFGEHARFA